MNEQRDEQLWKIAKKRASFQRGLAGFFIVNAFLWGVWWFTQGRHGADGVPWPVWVMLGWGIGLGFKYKGIQVDYALTDIGDQSAALYSNIFSLKIGLGIFR